MQKFNKFSKICSVAMVRHQHLRFMTTIAMKQPLKDPLRCIKRFEREHCFIKATLQSFQVLLNEIKQGSPNTDMLEKLNDYKQFSTFLSQYNAHHTTKEAMLLNSLKQKCTNPDVLKTDCAYNLFESSISQNLEVIPSEKSMTKSYEIMEKEENQIFPAIIYQLSPNEMEELSEELDCFDNENNSLLTKLEFISVELNAKY